jgi:hypothetical protein
MLSIQTACARLGRVRLILSWLLLPIFWLRIFNGPEIPLAAFFGLYLSRILEPEDSKPVTDKQRLVYAAGLLIAVPITALLLRDMKATATFFRSAQGHVTLLVFWLATVLSDVPHFRRLPSLIGDPTAKLSSRTDSAHRT